MIKGFEELDQNWQKGMSELQDQGRIETYTQNISPLLTAQSH